MRIAVFGCGFTTWELISRLTKAGVRISHCITIDEVEADRQQASGFVDLVPQVTALGIEVVTVDSYDLSTVADYRHVTNLELDLGLCAGWQRLLPEWCLESTRCGVYGMHGSNRPPPHGRGRSPLNWSLVLDKRIFYTYLFRYDAGVDSGPIVDIQSFDINYWDTAYSLHLKNVVTMSVLCLRHLDRIIDGSVELFEQPENTPSYYPKRTDEDGRIYWDDSTSDIYNLIRAVTRPFPGAWTFWGEKYVKVLRIWDACPFDTRLTWPNSGFGEIVEVFADGTFVVRTGDGSLYVREYGDALVSMDDIGTVLQSGPETRKRYTDLPT